MKGLLSIALALALLVAVGVVSAEELEGKIQSVNTGDRAIVLDNGTQIWIAEGVPMDKVKEGATVKLTYEERDGKKVATTLEVSE